MQSYNESMSGGKGHPITLLKPGCLIARMGESQSDLNKQVPIDYIMNWVGSKLDDSKRSKGKTLTMNDRVIVLLSKTGSGKSTSIAPNIYLRFFDKYRKRILITQPRVLTAMEIPRDIANIPIYQKPNAQGLSIELYRNLGYQTQEFVRKPKERGILFTTTGIVLQFLKTMSDADFIKRFKFIIIDEAHDRSLDVDLVLFMMKNLIKRNLTKDPPYLILMSATLNVSEYATYFETKTIFEVSGQSKPIEVRYPPIDIQDIYSQTMNIITELSHLEETEVKQDPEIDHMIKNGIRDIIIFMPSISYISRMVKSLERLNESIAKKILPLAITAFDINQGSENYRMLMAPTTDLKLPNGDKPFRRVIVSTNVAETGLTLESLRYCIDTALVFTNEYNPRYDAYMFVVKPTTASMSLQRKGRVGRKFPGVFYPLFTEQVFNHMVVDNTPSILVENITSHILAMIARSPSGSAAELPVSKLLTPPSDESVSQALETLFTLGAIDKYGAITKTGQMLNVFRKLPIQSCKMIIAAIVYGISLKEMVTLACLLEIKKSDIVDTGPKAKPLTTANLFIDLYHNQTDCDYANYSRFKAKLLISCEFLELLLLYQRFTFQFSRNQDITQLKTWCFEKGLVFNTLMKLSETIEEVLWGIMHQLKVNPTRFNSDLYRVLKRTNDTTNPDLVRMVCAYKSCIYEGYKMNILTWDSARSGYYNRHGIKVNVESKLVSELSFQQIGAPFKQNRPKLLVYKNLFLKKGQFDTYEWFVDTISVMDGFVTIDPEFLLT
jgi:HrpA-like RNA helicase